MRTSAKLGLTALIAALLLSTAISTASARNLSVSNRNIRVTWSLLEFRSSLGVTIRCRVTLEGSFHTSTIAKVQGTLIGAISRTDVDGSNCTNARATAEGLPWHITYEGFRGTLPRFEEVFLLLRRTLFNLGNVLGTGAECRYGTASDNITGRAIINASSEATNLVPVTGRNIANLLERRRETALVRCPATGVLEAGPEDGVITLLGTTTRIRVTLI